MHKRNTKTNHGKHENKLLQKQGETRDSILNRLSMIQDQNKRLDRHMYPHVIKPQRFLESFVGSVLTIFVLRP